jgi:allantoicase
MDGWETRRKRIAGHDWCILKLAGNGGKLYGIEIDTAHFTGNQAPRVSILAANYNERKDADHASSEVRTFSAYSWMPGALDRLAQGVGTQGTGKSVQDIAHAEQACQTFTWTEILPMTSLKPGYEDTRMHYFMISDENQVRHVTHVRLNIFPDGGIARVRLWGYKVEEDRLLPMDTSSLDTALVESKPQPSSQTYHLPQVSLCTHGGLGLVCSNKHYGIPHNLIQESYGKDMGDGWETARHPFRPAIIVKDPVTDLVDSPLMDWAILKLGMGGILGGEEGGVSRIIIDTKHFRGNYPESVRLEGCCYNDESDLPDESYSTLSWFELIPRSRLGPDREHVFDRELQEIRNDRESVTHVRVSIFPDGGLSRIRIYGTPRHPK